MKKIVARSRFISFANKLEPLFTVEKFKDFETMMDDLGFLLHFSEMRQSCLIPNTLLQG